MPPTRSSSSTRCQPTAWFAGVRAAKEELTQALDGTTLPPVKRQSKSSCNSQHPSPVVSGSHSTAQSKTGRWCVNPFSAAGEGHPIPHVGLKFKKLGPCLRANEPHAQAEQKSTRQTWRAGEGVPKQRSMAATGCRAFSLLVRKCSRPRATLPGRRQEAACDCLSQQ